MSIAVIVPSRGRPASIERLIPFFLNTSLSADLHICIDTDDPQFYTYRHDVVRDRVFWQVGPRLRLGGTLNHLAPKLAEQYDIIGFMGDDHLPSTARWDEKIGEALQNTGIAYGNDLFRGADLPTAVFMTSDIIRKIGYMVPPGAVHLYLDDFWLALGRGIDSIHYLPDVIIEHLHPSAGKAQIDAGYTEVNAPALYESDRAVFNRYLATQLAHDVEKIRG